MAIARFRRRKATKRDSALCEQLAMTRYGLSAEITA